MWSKKTRKLNVFLILMILVNIAKGEILITVELPEKVIETSTVPNTLVSQSATEPFDPTESPQSFVVTESAKESVTEVVTDQIECVCDCIANGNQVKMECSTQSPEETQPQSDDTETIMINEDISSTNSNKVNITITSNVEDDSTTPKTTLANTISTPISCSTPAQVQPHESDCHQYYECSAEESQDGSFHFLEKSCPEKQAFNIELNRCSREISSCSVPIQCIVKGGVADPASNSSYYLCEPRLIGVGYRIFHVECSSNEVFYPELGKCFIDFNNIPTVSFPPYNWNQIRDIEIVKAELKLLKEQEKFKLKQEKEHKKAEEKLQKELEKEAKKHAKELEKANKEKIKQQAATFVCVVEGNFPSSVSDSTYIACINKKGKLKALAMQCGFGAKFDAETGICISGPDNINSSMSTEDDD